VVLLGHAICWERNKSKKVFLLTILDQKKTIRTKIERCLCRVRWHLHFFAFAFEWMTNIPFLWKLNQKWLDIRLTRVWVSVWGRLSSLKIDKKCFLLFYLFYFFYFCVTFRLFGHFCYFLFRQCTIIRGMRRIQLLIGWISSALSIYLVAGNKLMSSY
jgi:hypothetical protein